MDWPDMETDMETEIGKYRETDHYITTSVPGEQVTLMADNWYVVHHTSIRNDYWWAVRHQCPDGRIFGMAFRPGTTMCNGCNVSLPIEIEGFINLMEWER